MPNKTIYVSDDDLPLFQRAQELVGGNLSGAIVTALRRFIEIQEGREVGYEEVILRVGPDGVRKQRFSGRLLAEWTRYTDGAVEKYQAYQGRSGKFVLHVQRSDWSRWRADDSGNWLEGVTSLRSLRGLLRLTVPDWGDFTLEVFDSLAQLRTHVPSTFYRRVADAVEHPRIEDLDV